ncbi:hypothetical protein RHGRI_035524 [Rhododendron griersonianum]|uniref:Cytochrome c oxidase subunit 5C n=1 Tax=Rhododendron griersonianum TaxID=479676 RepID=A0AAV6HME8_9ERIC|nr:hypothetical protein RHGRI_035524 [Rhododendron griersonianum]
MRDSTSSPEMRESKSSNGEEEGVAGSSTLRLRSHPILSSSQFSVPQSFQFRFPGPSVVKEIIIGFTLGLAAGGLWKMHHWNEQRKTRAFYDLLEKGEISVVAAEE